MNGTPLYAWRVMATTLLLATARMSLATSLQDCDADMTGFELVTGYVFTAPDDLLDSIPGTLMLTDCLEACHGNDTCYSVNYETGLCVMFSSNADAYPGKHQLYNNIRRYLRRKVILQKIFALSVLQLCVKRQ